MQVTSVFGNKARRHQGFSVQELLIVIAILCVLFALAVMSVSNIQKNLRQTELDAKAETIYTAAQNQLSKMYAGGDIDYQPTYASADTKAAVSENKVYWPGESWAPGDCAEEQQEDLAGNVYFLRSDDLNVKSSATYAIMHGCTDDTLGEGHWIIEYCPSTATVYSVYYTEYDDKADCLAYGDGYQASKDSAGVTSDYNNLYRVRSGRLQAGAWVGYHAGGSAEGTESSTIQAKITNQVNAETLSCTLTATRPLLVPEDQHLAFKVTLKDNEGHSYTAYYTYGNAETTINGLNSHMKKETNSEGYDVFPGTLNASGNGRTFTLELSLDALGEESERFYNLYGVGSGRSGAAEEGKQALACGTELTVDFDIILQAENYTVDLRDADDWVTNSLFADESNTYTGSGHNSTAVLTYGRHLQNLDESSGVNSLVELDEGTYGTTKSFITSAVQASDISFEASDESETDWVDTYSSSFFNGYYNNTSSTPNFKPITNNCLNEYDGGGNVVYGLSTNGKSAADAKAAIAAGLFGTIDTSNRSIKIHDLNLSGATAYDTSGSAASSAGTLIGAVEGTGRLEVATVQSYLNSAHGNLSGTEADMWVGAAYAGGLIGAIDNGGTVLLTNVSASTVIGSTTRLNTAGGLVGRNNAELSIEGSFADNYLYGKLAAGLIGENQEGSTTSISTSYAAGFIGLPELSSGQSTGAGLVGGAGAVKKLAETYSIVAAYPQADNGGIDHDSNKITAGASYSDYEYYSTAVAKPRASSSVYYFTGGSDNDHDWDGTDPVNNISSSELQKLLGSAFEIDTNGTTPYNLMGQTLTTYTYPRIAALDHYGDWESEFQSGALVYYEKYSGTSLTYGFYGAGLTSTLQNGGTVLGDGYGIVYKKNDSIPGKVTVTIGNNEPYTITTAKTTSYDVELKGVTYTIFPLPVEMVNPTSINTANYYSGVTITESTEGSEPSYYDFNPLFAHSQLDLASQASLGTSSLAANGNSVYVRTPRQLFNLSLFYESNARKDTTPVAIDNGGIRMLINTQTTFKQERSIDYASYEWSFFKRGLESGAIQVQAPIGTKKGKSFTAIYDGGCNIITNVSFESSDGQYIGLFGYNSGNLRNIVATVDYDKDDPNTIYYARRTSAINASSGTIYLGVLAGYSAAGAVINNCAVAGYNMAQKSSSEDGTIIAYENSYVNVGNLVGGNAGTISHSSADCPQTRISMTYATCNAAGFVGINESSGTIYECYGIGHMRVVSARGGNTTIAGFVASNSGTIYNSYCATALTTAEDSSSLAFGPSSGSINKNNCYYLYAGTYRYIGSLYSFNLSSDVATGKTKGELSTNSLNAAQSRYHRNTSDADGAYPYRPVVTDASGAAVHYGDWQDDVEMGSVGMFYWEHETGGNSGYKLTFVGLSETDTLADTTLCTSHDDGGTIDEYGYGYFQRTGDEGRLDASTMSDLAVGSSVNAKAKASLEQQLEGFTFYPYTTRYKESDDGTSYDDYIYMDGSAKTTTNGSWTLKYTNTSGTTTEYTFSISPFFANSFSLDKVTKGGANQTVPGIQITDAASTTTTYSSTAPGAQEANKYEVRSAAQLQYINWNNATKTTSEYLRYDTDGWYNINPKSTSSYQSSLYEAATKAQMFPYLGYAYPSSATANKQDHAANYYWSQSHDLAAQEGSQFTSLGSAYDAIQKNGSNNTALYTVYFNGSYKGNSYQIKNLSINSKGQAIGLFGVAIGCEIDSVIMYSDEGSIVEVDESGSGWYNAGCLVGMAMTGGTMITKMGTVAITNCAVAGYTLRDSRGAGTSDEHSGYGGCNEGGLVGLCNINVSRCSSVADLEINALYNRNDRNIRVGGLIGNYHGTTIENCYAGGSITKSTYNNTYISACGLALVGFVRVAGNLNSLFGTLVVNPTIQNCYSYTDLTGIDIAKSSVTSLCPVVSNGNVENSSTSQGTVKNCYYYEPKATTYKSRTCDIGKPTTKNTSTSTSAADVKDVAMHVSYDELAGNVALTSLPTGSTYLNKTITYALSAGSYETAKPTSASPERVGNTWEWVSTYDASGTAIDGKYSYPGNDTALSGKNYPFPTLLTAVDSTFGNEVNVHYGSWPKTGVYWAEGRATMDIFDSLDLSDTTEGGPYAYKTYVLYDQNDALSSVNVSDFACDGDDPVAEVTAVSEKKSADADHPYAYFEVTVKALHDGSGNITFEQGSASAEFALTVTANLDVTADPAELKVNTGKSGTMTFTAKSDSGNDFSTAENLNWTVELADSSLEGIASWKSDESAKNVYTITRSDVTEEHAAGGGEFNLSVTGTYTYNGHEYASADLPLITEDAVIGIMNGDEDNATADYFATYTGKTATAQEVMTGPSASEVNLYASTSYESQGEGAENLLSNGRVTGWELEGGSNKTVATWDSEAGAWTCVYNDGASEEPDDCLMADFSSACTTASNYTLRKVTLSHRGITSDDPVKNVSFTVYVTDVDNNTYTMKLTGLTVQTNLAINITLDPNFDELEPYSFENKGRYTFVEPGEVPGHANWARDYYDFVGWREIVVDEEGNEQEGRLFTEGESITESISVRAEWLAHSYNIRYLVDNVRQGDTEHATHFEDYTITREGTKQGGYTFYRWEAADGTLYAKDDTLPAGSITGNMDFNAIFSYQITLQDEDGSSSHVFGADNVLLTTDGSLDESEYTSYYEQLQQQHSGLRLEGWFDEYGDNLIAADGSFDASLIKPSTTYTAKWSDTFALTLVDGSRTIVDAQACENGADEVTWSEDALLAAGSWTLEGWYTEASSSGKKVINANGSVVTGVSGYTDGEGFAPDDEEVTLYACWQKGSSKQFTHDFTLCTSSTDGTTIVCPVRDASFTSLTESANLYDVSALEGLAGWYANDASGDDDPTQVLGKDGAVKCAYGVLEKNSNNTYSLTDNLTLYMGSELSAWMEATSVEVGSAALIVSDDTDGDAYAMVISDDATGDTCNMTAQQVTITGNASGIAYLSGLTKDDGSSLAWNVLASSMEGYNNFQSAKNSGYYLSSPQGSTPYATNVSTSGHWVYASNLLSSDDGYFLYYNASDDVNAFYQSATTPNQVYLYTWQTKMSYAFGEGGE